jgi:hypothetical protein
MVSKAVLGRFYRNYIANQIVTKNADASRPSGKHWDVSAQDYVSDGCDTGYHLDDNTYRCVAD